MKKKFHLVLFLMVVLAGCAKNLEGEVHTYSPRCTPSDLTSVINEAAAIQRLECHDMTGALLIAKQGAQAGNSRMAILYLNLLNENNDVGAGLIYALRYAEAGDEGAINWLLRITKKYKIISLVQPVSEMYVSLFTRDIGYKKPLLDEYLDFSMENVEYNGNVTLSYSSKLIELSKSSISKVEYENSIIFLDKLKLKANFK